jgi:hypothetical protein
VVLDILLLPFDLVEVYFAVFLMMVLYWEKTQIPMIGKKRVFWEKNQIPMIGKKRVFCHHEAFGLLVDSIPRLIAPAKGLAVVVLSSYSSSLCESAVLTQFFLVTLAAVAPQFSEERLWKVHPEFESWRPRLLLDLLEGA